MSFEKMAVQGRLGQDAELRFLPSGTPLLSFSVAIEPSGPDSANQATIWRKVTVWGDRAQRLADEGALLKGAAVYAEGVPKLREWDGKDGQHHVELALTASVVQPIAAFRAAAAAAGPNPEPDDSPW